MFDPVLLAALSGTTFSPRALFAGGEQGAWYDPSDFNTMFQDSAGTTPVTAAGQPVGLILDKSKGLEIGAELVTNGDFSSGLTDWTTGAALTSSIVSGEAQITFAGSAAVTPGNWFFQPNKLSSTTATYKVTFDATWVSGGVLQVSSGYDVQATISANASKTTYSVYVKRGSSGTASDQQTFALAGAAGAVWKIDNVSIRFLAGNHASQATSTSRPVLQQETTGQYYLAFDGVDDSLSTASIDFSATNKMTVFVGLRKASDAAQGVFAELTASIAANNGGFLLSAPNSAAANYNFSSKGTTQVDNVVTTYTAPITSVITGQGDISIPSNIIRVNGVQAGSVATTQGTGNYANAALNIGRRGGATLPFSGRLYSLIVRGAATNADQLSRVEAWVNSKTNAY